MTYKRGLTDNEFTILGMLVNNEMCGVQIIAFSTLEKVTVYAVLKRLEKWGLITSRKEEQDGPGLPRRFYKPTARGTELHKLTVKIQWLLNSE